MKILVVDDDTVSRLVLARVLADIDSVEVVEAASGDEAWRLLTGGLRPMVCCIDIHMPGMGGLALMDLVRDDPVLASLSFVVISSAADRTTIEAALRKGAAGYVIKPYKVVDTRATVQRVMRQAVSRRSDNAQTVCRRMQIAAGEYARMLDALHADTQDLMTAPAAPGKDAVVRIRTACLMLGLWHGAALLEQLLDCEPALDTSNAVLAEVARFVQEHAPEAAVS